MPLAVGNAIGADATTAYLPHTVSGEAIVLDSGEAIVLDDVDTVVLAQGHRPETALEHELEGWTGEVHLAGDCLAPRTAGEAVPEGLQAGWTL